MLTFDWQAVEEASIKRVVGRGRQLMNDNAVLFEALAIETDRGWIAFEVLADIDELSVLFSESGPDLAVFRDASDVVSAEGQGIGWSWCARNSQGCVDVFLLGLFRDEPTDAVSPSLAFMAVGSMIEVYDLTVRRDALAKRQVGAV